MLETPPSPGWRPTRGRDEPEDQQPAHDQDAERQVLGSAMLSAAAATELAGVLHGPDFWEPAHETIWDAIANLHAASAPVSVVSVADQLRANKTLSRVGGPAYLHDLISAVITAANADFYAQILRQHTLRRAFQTSITRLQQLATVATDPITAVTTATLEVAELRRQLVAGGQDHGEAAPDVDTFLAGADDNETPDWLIPEVLERQDRLIITAGEGHGKSTLLRQIAVQTAAGIHPFTGDRIEPQRVLIVDLENSERQTRRKLRPLRLQAGQRLDPTMLHICCHVQGLNLADPTDRAWLEQIVLATSPALLVTGPIYKMGAGNPNDEKDAKPVATALDELRARHDIAIILEAHSAKTPAGVNPKNRPKEPVGWSGWMRWPEFGIHLAEDGKITHWRGMRDERFYPETMARGGRWPWTPASQEMDSNAARWLQIYAAIVDAGHRLSGREIEAATGIPRVTAQRVLSQYASEANRLYSEMELPE